ncbi:hypothetical protein HU675_0045255 [Bradyrhizobium septentrionale]|uniref:head-tail joining protein n=1 Tax=Bradyrhizobium septentrionale TaxID=1404411 RepID=UPI001596888D|nr:hypothetical protein [Bradyrhizobium septentrionale]UGY21513.1 hypothetical protein HU675_0026155 [Bradyrhizobium septentrionale]UGY24709.1 hypothetical protein HU675_0043595 [Bradyrhizobium septentrionale]UGY25001.1 hypothetical protein HU675_0045255 [Bradyrhizobium septentrionale]
MAVNLDVLLQGPIFDFWAVPVVFKPIKSQPGQPDYTRRGILNTYSLDVAGLDGQLYSDQRTILDIRESEFDVLPQQDDHLVIPLDCNDVPRGEYQIVDASSDGGGQTMLTIRKFETIM